MDIDHIPLLQTARDLHDVPRGIERFNAYIKTILNDERTDAELVPLIAMNPMGRQHVAARLDEWLALDADVSAAEITREAGSELDDPGHFKHGLVILDDVRGGWTNKYTSDAAFRFGEGRYEPKRAVLVDNAAVGQRRANRRTIARGDSHNDLPPCVWVAA